MNIKKTSILAPVLAAGLIGASNSRAEPFTGPDPDDIKFASYSIDGQIKAATDIRTRGISDTFKRPGAQLEIDFAHESGLIAMAQFNNVSKKELTFGNGLGMLLALGWRGGNPDGLNYGIGLATERFPGAKYYDAPQTFDGETGEFSNLTSGKYNTDYAVLELGYGRLHGRIVSTLSKSYRGANSGGVCGWLMDYGSKTGDMDTLNKGVDCYSRSNNKNSRGSLLLDLNYDYPLRSDTKLNLHAGYQSVRHFREANTFDYLVGVTHTRWGVDWSAAVTGARVRTPALYMYDDGSGRYKKMYTPGIVLSSSYRF